MSRWNNKNRVQSFAFPLDSLVKEKENTNRPVAARSAGTVGKWGTTSFTSIRTPSYAYASFSPQQDALNPNISPQSGDGHLTPNSPQVQDAPKPKKFFKSRNVAPEAMLPHAHHLYHPQSSPSATISHINQPPSYATTTAAGTNNAAPKIRLKINKKLLRTEEVHKVKVEKIKSKKVSRAKEKVPKVPDKPEKIKVVVQPTRVLSRTRKPVNYTENRSRSPSPQYLPSPDPPPPPPPEEVNADDEEEEEDEDIETASNGGAPAVSSDEDEPMLPSISNAIASLSPTVLPSNVVPMEYSAPPLLPPPPPIEQQHIPIAQSLASSSLHHPLNVVSDVLPIIGSPVHQPKAAHDHPPIVLRISKGTSRLISTDSEEVIHSPPYLSPAPVPLTPVTPAIASTAELLAVLSDDLPPPPARVVTPTPAVPVIVPSIQESEKSKPKGIKIKIKTNLAHAFLVSTNGAEAGPSEECPPKIVKITKPKPPPPPPPPPPKRSTRSTRRNQIDDQIKTDQNMKHNSPQPGNENYDLYRTLTSPSDDKDFDSQSSMLESISSTFAVGVPDDSHVICSRGSSNITSDQDTSQDSSLVAPPSEIDERLTNMECDTEMENTLVSVIEVAEDDEYIPRDPTPPPPLTVAPILRRGTRRLVKSPSPVFSSEPVGPQSQPTPPPPPPPPVVKEGRVTRNNNNGLLPPPIETTVRPVAAKIYGRKRKPVPIVDDTPPLPPPDPAKRACSHDPFNNILENDQTIETGGGNNKGSPHLNQCPSSTNHSSSNSETEYKKQKKTIFDEQQFVSNVIDLNNSSDKNVNNNLDNVESNRDGSDSVHPPVMGAAGDDSKPSVKLVISKKKGSIFKSRAIDVNTGGENSKPKRHVYRHKWDDDNKEKAANSNAAQKPEETDKYYNEFDEDGEPSGTLTRVTRSRASPDMLDDEGQEEVTSVRCDSKAKTYYTVVRNVKKAHQIQEIGEFQEMDDDVDYILDALQSHNPMATRCLSAIQLASKCMTPAFRMHVRAHGTITKFFKALTDAKNTQSLGLCTATVMFVLNQDNLNMDLDRDSLGLMLNLLESDVSHRDALDDCGLTSEQLQRNKLKVKEICSEIKSQGKAVYLNLDNITVGTLAMETLLSLTSKRFGEWFKEELRTLGGLEKIIETICECCRQISDYVVDWTDALLEKLRKIERCLRVLENVSTQNEENQTYILSYRNGHAVDSLVKFYKLCDREIALYPTSEQTPKDNPGVVLREALVPTLKVLINLSHPFCTKALGSALLGEKLEIFDTSLHLLLQASHYVPDRCIFELNILVLLLLINLTTHTMPNRVIVMEASAPSDFGNQFDKVSAIKALIEYFYNCEELARMVEMNTDAILENPKKSERKPQSQEEVEETVTKLLQKAGHHMEHTMIASYVCLLIGHLIMDSDEHQRKVRQFLKNERFTEMVQVLEKYYNFMNLTASSEASVVAHIRQTKLIIEYFQKCDTHSNTSMSGGGGGGSTSQASHLSFSSR